MYTNAKKHILSNSIMMVAIIKVLAAFCEAGLRFILQKQNSLSPDMLDTVLWRSQLFISAAQIVLATLVFFFAWKKLNYYISLIPAEDRKEMGLLQKEFIGDKIASLSGSSVSRLLQLWTVIFVGSELIYVFTSIMYRRFISILMTALSGSDGLTDGTFVMLYNMTHGFKYIEMLCAILLGVVMTGIFLSDPYLRIASLVILVLFMLAFGVFQMQTVSLMGRSVGIVWTSLIYHATETIGLFLLALYLSRRYRGL
ncbi:hypothetical protein [Butyrivibrio sp. MB2005]|uniref:hypothetical protein n=1 Tax=Butyrivibrio sp. MB2005 TaxID=1280678 RepID=UPI000420C5A2|nr:hypothetical protein [Butyrivibrio sp. MB2005]